jgi:hypothetical protein
MFTLNKHKIKIMTYNMRFYDGSNPNHDKKNQNRRKKHVSSEKEQKISITDT